MVWLLLVIIVATAAPVSAQSCPQQPVGSLAVARINCGTCCVQALRAARHCREMPVTCHVAPFPRSLFASWQVAQLLCRLSAVPGQRTTRSRHLPMSLAASVRDRGLAVLRAAQSRLCPVTSGWGALDPHCHTRWLSRLHVPTRCVLPSVWRA